MKRLLALAPFCLAFALCPVSGQAQTASSSSSSSEEPNLVDAMANLMVVTYACQEVSGYDKYTQAKTMSHTLFEKMVDTATADEFVKVAEDNAKGACPDTKTCWTTFLDDGVAATPANGKAACDSYTDIAAGIASDELDKETGSSSSS